MPSVTGRLLAAPARRWLGQGWQQWPCRYPVLCGLQRVAGRVAQMREALRCSRSVAVLGQVGYVGAVWCWRRMERRAKSEERRA